MINKFYQNNITKVYIPTSDFELNIKSSTFFIGSCFANNLYNTFDSLYLNSHLAPFGNVYNPKSIENSLYRIINNTPIIEDDCFIVDGLYQHFDFHSYLGQKNKELFIESINKKIYESHINLLKSDLIIITLGTAYIYEKSDKVVNNCHKLPKDSFIRREMSVDEITHSLTEPLLLLKEINKKIKIILTLSPVRHLRDSAIENSYSKSLLRVAINNIVNETNAYYFPSYEILLDELRDYRWYETNMTHPNKTAIEYITDNFFEQFKTDELSDYINKIEKVNKMKNHKIINNESDSSIQFIKSLESKINNIKKEYGFLEKINNI